MSDNNVITFPTAPSIKLQLGKMLVATSAAFLATKLAENVFDRVVEKHQNKTAPVQD
jgi:hypothetical protein